MEKVEIFKQTGGKFVLSEAIIFLSQVFIFFMVAVFTSNFLNNEDKLVKFSEQKLNGDTFPEIGLIFLAILIVIGILSAIGRVFDNKTVEKYIHEILCEIPKTVYFFGSSITGVLIAVTLFLHIHPDNKVSFPQLAVVTVAFAITSFVYGCILSYAFKRKTHILSKNSQKKSNEFENNKA